MYIVDSHCDTLQFITAGESDELINRYNFSEKYPQLQFVAAFCGRPKETEMQSYERAVAFIKAFDEVTNTDTLARVRTYEDIENALHNGKHAALFTAEGAGKAILGNPALVREFYDAGVRVIGICWESNAFAKSNRLEEGEYDSGLSVLGRDVCREIDSLGMILDVSHLSDKSFYDTAELAKKPIIASHSNFRSVCAHSRNLTDDMARLIFERDGMIGLNFYPPFISEKSELQTVEGLLLHLEHGLSLGGEDHIGFGGDIDGTSGRYPYPLTVQSSIHDKIIEIMLRKNYSESLVRKIAGENYLNFLKKYL